MGEVDGIGGVAADDFARRFSMRPGRLMWLLGAGVSAAAGVMTAGDMIWRFKRELYVTQRKASRQVVEELSNLAVRKMLDAFVAESETLPSPGAPDEYSALFEATYPQEQDRRTYVEHMIQGMQPTLGHLSLAALMKAKHSNIVWTTNFDHLFDDACAKTFGTTAALSIASLDGSGLAGEFISEQQWPIEIKLHGDFRSRRLKNTGEELRHQDAKFRRQLVDACRRFGLVVAGYSGRDESIMDALEAALDEPDAFPGGLFWLHRGDQPPFGRVADLLKRAEDANIESGLVQIENFDEAMVDLLRLLPDVDQTHMRAEAQERRRLSFASAPAGTKGYPVLRLNALAVTYPINCRKIVCGVDGSQHVRDLVEASTTGLIAARSQAGVIGFGSDADFREVFQPFGITDFGLLTFEERRLRYDSQERGLLRRALAAAVARQAGMVIRPRRSRDLLVPRDPLSADWQALRDIVGPISGPVPKDRSITWREGLGLRLEWASDRLWLLLEPRILFDDAAHEQKAIISDFARERTVRRYNPVLDRLVDFWSRKVAGENLRAIGIGDGIDATFTVGSRSAHSWAVKP